VDDLTSFLVQQFLLGNFRTLTWKLHLLPWQGKDLGAPSPGQGGRSPACPKGDVGWLSPHTTKHR